MGKRALFVVTVICGALVAGTSPSAGAEVVTPTLVTLDGNRDTEVDIAINPADTKNLVAAWNDRGVGHSCGVGYSDDGGQSWHTDWIRGITAVGGNPDFEFAGDPSVGFLNDGTAVVVCNAWGPWPDFAPNAVYSSRSTDGGRTWEPAQEVARGKKLNHLHDHPMMTIDHYGNRVLLAYTVFLGTSNGYARSYALVSSDGGRTYQGPFEIAADYRAQALWRFDVSLAGAPDGTIYATSGIWQDIDVVSEQAVVVSQLRPGETKFSRSVKVRDLVPAPETLPGESWRTSMQASIGVAPDGTIDLLTGDFVTGNLDIYLARSSDHGASFPSQVNLTNDASDQVMPWLSVAPSGRIDVIFYDYVRSPSRLAVVYGQVPAGGTTMARTVLQDNVLAGNFMGDYLGIDTAKSVADPTNDVVALAWIAGRCGPSDDCLEVYAAALTP
jgi:hypothetical protein